jgi:hypothetical protein
LLSAWNSDLAPRWPLVDSIDGLSRQSSCTQNPIATSAQLGSLAWRSLVVATILQTAAGPVRNSKPVGNRGFMLLTSIAE